MLQSDKKVLQVIKHTQGHFKTRGFHMFIHFFKY